MQSGVASTSERMAVRPRSEVSGSGLGERVGRVFVCPDCTTCGRGFDGVIGGVGKDMSDKRSSPRRRETVYILTQGGESAKVDESHGPGDHTNQGQGAEKRT